MANPFSYEGKRVVITGAYSGVGAALLELLDELGAEHITVLDLKEPSGPATKFVPGRSQLRGGGRRRGRRDRGAGARAVQQRRRRRHDAGEHRDGGELPRGAQASPRASRPRCPKGVRSRSPRRSPAGSGRPTSPRSRSCSTVERLGRIARLDRLASRPVRRRLLGVEGVHAGLHDVDRAGEQQRGMRINSVCPSPIDTPLLPDFRETMTEKTIDWAIEQCGRVAQPRDIAPVLAFLGADASGYRERREPQRRPRLHRRPWRWASSTSPP